MEVVNKEMVDSLRLIRDAIRLSAHVLSNDPRELAGQLAGRLLSTDSPRIQHFLVHVRASATAPWLCPLTSVLSQAGGALVRTLTGHPSGVNCVAVTPDGHTAVSGSGRRWEGPATLNIWNLDSGLKTGSLGGAYDGFSSIALTRDGKRAVTGCADASVRVWDLEQGDLVYSLKEHKTDVNDVALTPDGRSAVSCCNELPQGENVILWDIEQGRKVAGLRFTDEEGIRQREERDGLRPGSLSSPLGISCISVTADGRFAVFGWGGVRSGWTVWDLKHNEVSRVVICGGVHAVATFPDSQHIITASGAKMRIWELKSGIEKNRLKGHAEWKAGETFKTGSSDAILSIAVARDGRRAISASGDRTLKLWDLDQGTEVTSMVGHSGPVNAVALTEDGYGAVSGSSDKSVKIWDLRRAKTPEVLAGHFLGVNTLSISPDGHLLVSGSNDNTIKVWDLEQRREVFTLKGHRGSVLTVAVTPDSRYAVSSADLNDGALRIWDLGQGQQVGCLQSVDDSIRALAVTSDGRYAVYGLGAGIVNVDDYRLAIPQIVKRWALDERNTEDRDVSGSPIYDVMDEPDPMKNQTLTTLAVMPGNRRAITGSTDNTLGIWDLETGSQLRTLTGHGDNVQSVVVTRDGRYAISGSADRTVRVWDLIGNEPARILTGHSGSVSCVALAPDCRRLVSASLDASLKVWNLASGELLTSFTGEGPLLACAVAPDGETIVAGDSAGRLVFLCLNNG